MNPELTAKVKFLTYLAEDAERFALLLPHITLSPRARLREALIVVTQIVQRVGLEIDDLDGDCGDVRSVMAGHRLFVNTRRPLEEQVLATLHQVAHLLDRRAPEPDASWEYREVVAEAVAALAAVHMGLPIEAIAVPTLAAHGASVEVMRAVMDRVLGAAHEIEVAAVKVREGWEA